MKLSLLVRGERILRCGVSKTEGLCVGDAWYQFCVEKQDFVKSVFRKVGLSLPIDGSADHELDIKGFAGIVIGDWKSPNDEPAVDYLDMNREHDDCDSIDFVADGE